MDLSADESNWSLQRTAVNMMLEKKRYSLFALKASLNATYLHYQSISLMFEVLSPLKYAKITVLFTSTDSRVNLWMMFYFLIVARAKLYPTKSSELTHTEVQYFIVSSSFDCTSRHYYHPKSKQNVFNVVVQRCVAQCFLRFLLFIFSSLRFCRLRF